MKISKLTSNDFQAVMSREDMRTIYDCILNAVDLMGEGEFHARVGATHEEALQILNVIGDALDAP